MAGSREPLLQEEEEQQSTTIAIPTTPKPIEVIENLQISGITLSGATVSWNVAAADDAIDAADLAGLLNITQFTVYIRDFSQKIFEEKNVTTGNNTYTIERELSYSTKYTACVLAWIDHDVIARPINNEVCTKFVTRYDFANPHALAALAVVLLIFFSFIGFHALAFALNPGQASSLALKKQLLDVQYKRRESKKNLGKDSDDEWSEKSPSLDVPSTENPPHSNLLQDIQDIQ